MNAAQSKTKRSGSWATIRQIWKRHWELYLLFLPVAIWFIIFHYIPMGGIVIAFKDFKILKGIADSAWVGLDNFKNFIESPAFRSTFVNTICISAYNLVFRFPVPILFAVLLNELTRTGFKRFVQTVSYLPHFISWAVAGGLLYMLLSPTSGPVNALIKLFGGTAINFMGKSEYFRSIVVLSGIWKSMGWSAIIYIAAITGIDEELYEAASVDGANRFNKIFHITLPSIANVIVIMLILAVGNIMVVDFEQIFILINDAVLPVGETIQYYIYRVGLFSTNNYSLAAAVGLFNSLIGFVLIVITNKVSKRISDGGGIW